MLLYTEMQLLEDGVMYFVHVCGPGTSESRAHILCPLLPHLGWSAHTSRDAQAPQEQPVLAGLLRALTHEKPGLIHEPPTQQTKHRI